MLVKGPNDFFQARQRSLQVRLRVRERIHFLCVSSVQHAQYGEIERDYVRSEDNLWTAVVEGGTASQRSCSFKDCIFSRPLALRPIYWKISGDAYTYFKMESTHCTVRVCPVSVCPVGVCQQKRERVRQMSLRVYSLPSWCVSAREGERETYVSSRLHTAQLVCAQLVCAQFVCASEREEKWDRFHVFSLPSLCESARGGERERGRERMRENERDKHKREGDREGGRERKRERERDGEGQRETERDGERQRETERERESVCVCVCVCMERGREK